MDDESKKDVDRRNLDQTRFRVETTVTITHILTTIALVFSIFSWGTDVKSMVSRHDIEIQDLKSNMRYDREVLRSELRELNQKIDRISERVGAGARQ